MQSNEFNFKGVLIFLAVIVAMMLAVYAVTAGFWRHLEKQPGRRDAEILAQATAPSTRTQEPYFPQPREQPNPTIDLQSFRAQEDGQLTSYGWVDKKAGIVRIPIDRAMELVLRQETGKR